MKRTHITYGQLDRALRSFGFNCGPTRNVPPGRYYDHPQSAAVILLPAYPESDGVYEHHLIMAQMELENFGLADATAFAAKLQKAG